MRTRVVDAQQVDARGAETERIDPVIDWTQLDNSLLDPDYYVGFDYHAGFSQLRTEDPVRWVQDERYGKAYWAITRYDDINEVLTNGRDFSSRWQSRVPRTPQRITPEQRHEQGIDVRITELDAPVHDLYRRPVNKHFSVPKIATMRGEIEQIVDDIIDAVAEKGECDLVEDIAAELPVRVILNMLGAPQEDWPYLREAAWQWLASSHPRWMVNNDPVETSQVGLRKLLDYCTDLALERRKNPTEDFATAIGDLEVDGDKLSIHEMKVWFVTLIGGGLETTRNAAAVGLWALMARPDQRRLLADQPDLNGSAVEEVMRWVTPTRNRLRIATRDMDFHGKRIRRGDWVVSYLVSANRDERKFENANDFDVVRNPKHLALGAGPHMCLGRALARLELETLVPRVLTTFPDMHTTVDEPAWLVDTSVTGFAELPVAYSPVRVPSRTTI